MEPLEQERRDFKAANPDLYAYIEARVTATALDSAGDLASGFHEGVACRLWDRGAAASRQAETMRRG